MEHNIKLPSYMKVFNDRQRTAIELMASRPGLKTGEAAEALNCTTETIRAYRRDPAFNDAVYSRFMEISGGKLIDVVDSMIREATKGNVQAATLVLKHYGKLEDKITLRIESPFEKFLKIGNIDEAEVIEENDAVNIGKAVAITSHLPERDESNDRPLKKTRAENKKVRAIQNGTYKQEKRTTRRKKAYNLRMRAEKVGMDMLPPGRQRKNVREEWVKELESREQAMGIV
jgi:hypothetical protein